MWKICISFSAPVNNREKGEYTPQLSKMQVQML
jgi:hypothetical protein